MVLVSRIAHDLVDAGRIKIPQKPTEHMRMAQAGIAGKMVRHRDDADRHVGGVDANGSGVCYVATIGQLAGGNAF